MRQLALQELTGELIISLQIGQQFCEPFSSVGIGRLRSKQPEGIGLAVAGGCNFLPEFSAQGSIFNEDVRELKSSQVEGLAGSGAGDDALTQWPVRVRPARYDESPGG